MEKAMGAALTNANVRIGTRETPSGPLRGIYATRPFSRGEWVCSFHGRIVPRDELARAFEKDKPLFESIVEYGVQPGNVPGAHLYPNDLDDLGAHLINHSCGPNSDWDRMAHGAMLVKATRPIAEGEEVTIHYRWVGAKAAMEGTQHACSCQAPYCAGTIELKLEYIVVEEDADGRRMGGHYLPPEEVKNRLLADILNDAEENESAVLNYPKNLTGMIMALDGGAAPEMQVDEAAFREKLRVGAAMAARELATVIVPEMRSGKRRGRPSLRRLTEIASRYGSRDPRP